MIPLTLIECNELVTASIAASLYCDTRQDRFEWMVSALVCAGWEESKAQDASRWLACEDETAS